VLASKSPLRPRPAADGQRFTHGEIFVAPPDRHMLVERGVIRLERSPIESRARPSVDALFRSAALAYGRRVVGVVLSGLLSDGSVGLWQIRRHGGIAIAQDPGEARG
jgi:two-component system chemotaxis response regulator CheB